MAGSPAEPLLFHRRAVRQGDDATNALYAGLFVETEPIYGRPCGHRPCGLQYAPAQREQANGFDGPASPEAGMAGISGYLGTLCHIKRSLSAPAEGLFLFEGCGHTSQSASLTAAPSRRSDSRSLTGPPIAPLPRNRLAFSAAGGASPVSPSRGASPTASPRGEVPPTAAERWRRPFTFAKP